MNPTLLDLTANMPMKQINLESKYTDNVPGAGLVEFACERPYLQRYYAGTFRDDVDLWIHRFLSNDGDRHLHSHPFEFSSVVLSGGYNEEYINQGGAKIIRYAEKSDSIFEKLDIFIDACQQPIKYDRPFSSTFLALARRYKSYNVFDWHRIAEVESETWTAVLVRPQRLPKWYFKSDDGEYTDMKASPRDWWKNYKIRPECGIAQDDNRL